MKIIYTLNKKLFSCYVKYSLNNEQTNVKKQILHIFDQVVLLIIINQDDFLVYILLKVNLPTFRLYFETSSRVKTKITQNYELNRH